MGAPNGNGTDCICNSGTAPGVVTLLFLFSVCVQAAEGLSFGIVPYISRPALGVVSGMVGGAATAVLWRCSTSSSRATRSGKTRAS